MRTCWRCGVKWDATGYIEDAPCVDCQDVTGEHYENVWKHHRGHPVPEAVMAERIRQLEHYTCDLRMSAVEIAKLVGISTYEVSRLRKRMTREVPVALIQARGVRRAGLGGARRTRSNAEKWELYELISVHGMNKAEIHRERGVNPRVMRKIEEQVRNGQVQPPTV